jgi:hypothetical protein
MNTKPNTPQQVATTGTAGAKLKTLGAFAAGGLASAVITTALLHGWGALASNGLNPFGDGGKATYKDADSRTGTAPQTGLTARPAPIVGQGQGIPGQVSAPVVMVTMMPTPAAMPASMTDAGVGFAPAMHQAGQATRQAPTRLASVPQPPAPVAAAKKPAAQMGSKPTAASGKVGGDWVAALMPGKAAPAQRQPSPYYYEYTANKGGKATSKTTTAPAAGSNWVDALMGNQPVKRTGGRVSQYQTARTALGSSAGQGGDRLTGGGMDALWAKGDVDVKPKAPRKSRLSVCFEKGGMVSDCVSEDF